MPLTQELRRVTLDKSKYGTRSGRLEHLHRVAALQDAVAQTHAPLIPLGYGVRQSYAAFIVAVRGL